MAGHTFKEPFITLRDYHLERHFGLNLQALKKPFLSLETSLQYSTTKEVSGTQLSSGLWLPIKKPFLAQADSGCHTFRGAILYPER